jgi:uncharacterized protein DUF4167
VRQGQQNRRGRGRNNNNNNRKGHHGNPLSRSFESNGPAERIRGTPAHIAEKYLSLAREAQSSGDPVLAENYLQHAEHYSRIIMAYRDQFNQPGDGSNGGGHRMRGPVEAGEGSDEFGDDAEGGDDGFQQPFVAQVPPGHQPQPRPQGGGEHHARPERHPDQRHHDQRQDHRQDQRPDRPFRRDQNRPRYGERAERPGFVERDRQPEAREPRGEPRNDPPQERAPEQVAEPVSEQPRRRERFQQVHEQPEFLRRPVRRARSSENGESGNKSEPTGE